MKALRSVEFLVVHHSASNPNTTTVETIYEWHTDPNRKGGPFEGIGYHWVITGDGHTHSTRPITMQGAHAPKVNSRSWGVCLVGDNTKDGMRWNEDQETALLDLIEAVQRIVPGIKVIGHRDTGQATECPGLDMAKWLAGVI